MLTSKWQLGLLLTVLPILPLEYAEEGKRGPKIEEILRLRNIGASTSLSPDGTRVAYSIYTADFERDRFLEHIWIGDVRYGNSRQFTSGLTSCYAAAWSPDSKWLSYLGEAGAAGSQIFLVASTGGPAIQITKAARGVQRYAWSPDGKTIAFTSQGAPAASIEQRRSAFGNYTVVGREGTANQLLSIQVGEAMQGPREGELYAIEPTLSVGGFSWSPDSSRIAFDAAPHSNTDRSARDIYVLLISSGQVRKIVNQPDFDQDPIWSPDGKQVMFTSAMGQHGLDAYTFELAVVAADGGNPRLLTGAFDGSPRAISWMESGIYFWANQKTTQKLYQMDPLTTAIKLVAGPDKFHGNNFSFNRTGNWLAFTAGSATELIELYVCEVGSGQVRKLTQMSEQIKPFAISAPEVIQWRSKDGMVIEGVLTKPENFDGKRKYPLLCLVHGGPSDRDVPLVLHRSITYPPEIWAAKGAMVLRVNYRGSSGYGKQFQRGSYRNLGMADGADILSGIDHLVAKGWADPAKTGCLGWSHGGYLCAYLAVTTRRFAAVSVGAGIADLAGLYYSGRTYIADYFGARPSDDAEVYRRSSPIAHVRGARTPMLLQHGDLDRVAPIDGAYQLRQAMEDQGVPVEMLVYRGFGHNINRPKGIRAVVLHNIMWFGHYIWGDSKPDFSGVH